jgi:hypothetical protein
MRDGVLFTHLKDFLKVKKMKKIGILFLTVLGVILFVRCGFYVWSKTNKETSCDRDKYKMGILVLLCVILITSCVRDEDKNNPLYTELTKTLRYNFLTRRFDYGIYSQGYHYLLRNTRRWYTDFDDSWLESRSQTDERLHGTDLSIHGDAVAAYLF